MNNNAEMLALQKKLEQCEKEKERIERELRVVKRRSEVLKSNFRSQISLNKAMEREKIRQEAYVELLLHHCPDIIIMLDEDLQFLFGTNSVTQVINVKDISLLYGMNLTTILDQFEPGVFTLGFLREISIAKREKGDFSRPPFEVNVDNKIFEVTVLPFNALSGEFAGVLVIMHEITDLVEAKNLAEQASRAKGEFLSRMSHEMRTPMNAVVGMTRIALQTGDPERKDYCLGKIEDASSHLLNIVNDILDLSKIEADKLELYNHPFDLRQTIEQLIGVLGLWMEEKNQKFSCNLDKSIPVAITGDELRFTQVVSNLLSNACKFTPEGGSIDLDVSCFSDEDSSYLRVEVADSGIGISSEQQSRMFSVFEQADGGTTRKFGGSGLGLAICKRIIDTMGGEIWIESKLGQGAKFIFTMPVTTLDKMVKNVEIKDEYIPDLSGRKILVAEDIEINREILEAVLEPTGAFLTFAENGLDAVSFFRNDLEFSPENGFDLVLMDIQMPMMDGFEATRTIRGMADIKAARIPIIAMTANVFREDVEKCIAAGANAHVGKPIDAVELFGILGQFLGE